MTSISCARKNTSFPHPGKKRRAGLLAKRSRELQRNTTWPSSFACRRRRRKAHTKVTKANRRGHKVAQGLTRCPLDRWAVVVFNRNPHLLSRFCDLSVLPS